jgi:hypothetical protein
LLEKLRRFAEMVTDLSLEKAEGIPIVTARYAVDNLLE